MAKRHGARRPGLSLVELLIVIAILATAFALLIGVIQRVRQTARLTGCVNNLHNLGIAFHNYHLSKKSFPTEGAPGSPSLYRSLIPYTELSRATDITPVPIFLCPSRRDATAGAKRDFGYAATQANGSSGPSVLDHPSGVTLAEIAVGTSTANTYLLTHVWMAPATYRSGDATDLGWASLNNGRTDNTTTRADGDPTGTTRMLGGPHAPALPTLYADGHVANLTNVQPQQWCYNIAIVRPTPAADTTSGTGSPSGSGSSETGTQTNGSNGTQTNADPTYTDTVMSKTTVSDAQTKQLDLSQYITVDMSNHSGLGEIWFMDKSGNLYYVLPNGNIYLYTTGYEAGDTVAYEAHPSQDTLLGSFGTATYSLIQSVGVNLITSAGGFAVPTTTHNVNPTTGAKAIWGPDDRAYYVYPDGKVTYFDTVQRKEVPAFQADANFYNSIQVVAAGTNSSGGSGGGASTANTPVLNYSISNSYTYTTTTWTQRVFSNGTTTIVNQSTSSSTTPPPSYP